MLTNIFRITQYSMFLEGAFLMDGEGCGGLFLLIVALGIIYVIVVYVIPIMLGIATIVFTIAAIIGILVGVFYAMRNFIVAVKATVGIFNKIGYFKNAAIQRKVHNEAPSGNYSEFVYEECARKNFFLGTWFSVVKSIITIAFSQNFVNGPDFSRGDSWYGRALFVVWSICQLIAQYILGTIVTLIFSLILIAISLVLTSIVYIMFSIVLLFETLYFKLKKVSFRCQKCTQAYKIPIYACPTCGIKHTRLKPGEFGIFKRKCVCGATLPLTVKSCGQKAVKDLLTGKVTYEKFSITDLNSFCPHCGNSDRAGITHPVSIALIGGASAGKTTFKVAFLKDFIDEEIVNYDIDYEFPTEEYENEFKKIESHYRGLPIPATPLGAEYDIITFSFMLKHKKFGVDRLFHFYDMPGEAFQKGSVQEGWHMFTFNDGAVLLIDPYSLKKIKEESESELRGSTMGISAVSMNDVVEALINTLRQVKTPKTAKGKFKIPIALTINKADSTILKKQIGDEAVKALMNAHPDVFNDYYVTMDYLCRCFLAENGCSGFIANLDANFETVHFFSSSPIGSVPKGARTPFYPINVLPIMQWLMLRTDKQLASAWTPEIPVGDLTDEQRKLYQTNKDYYNKIIANQLSVTTNS